MRNAPPEHPDSRGLPHLPHAVPSSREGGVNRVQGDGSGIPTWLESAACRDLVTELFFPVSPKCPGRRQADEAKAVCKPCPVRQQCASWALATAQQYGIWGGMDEEELVLARSRKRLRTRKRSSSRPEA
ncbi:WhiB family transcriptional regulator [Streptomyces sp. NPDC005708]|jgi:WhiB family redox-sensing transcriptional regulator|uniref:WhiB family transcriptional regulator n=1 Tax=unclassified Streptomyces TaxID=2593676 RepID=UPI0033E8F306